MRPLLQLQCTWTLYYFFSKEKNISFYLWTLSLVTLNLLSVVKGVTPSTGSNAGGTILRINGGEFDANITYTDAKAYVGGQFCQ